MRTGIFVRRLPSVTIPRDATGTFAVGIEGYRCAKIVGLTERTGRTQLYVGEHRF